MQVLRTADDTPLRLSEQSFFYHGVCRFLGYFTALLVVGLSWTDGTSRVRCNCCRVRCSVVCMHACMTIVLGLCGFEMVGLSQAVGRGSWSRWVVRANQMFYLTSLYSIPLCFCVVGQSWVRPSLFVCTSAASRANLFVVVIVVVVVRAPPTDLRFTARLLL